jgi:hypothetical protein
MEESVDLCFGDAQYTSLGDAVSGSGPQTSFDNIYISYLATKGSKANNAQISKVHASIRMIAQELGYSFSDMKLIVKEHSGLCYEAEGEVVCISFADCSSQEISAAIEAANQIAEENGIILG